MLSSRFTKHRGNMLKQDDRVQKYRPFMYLDRERQREILKYGHPDELTINQHLGGLCGMAMDEIEESSQVYGIIYHISQILEDVEFMPWNNICAFSNTVIPTSPKTDGGWDRIEELISVGQINIWGVSCPRNRNGVSRARRLTGEGVATKNPTKLGKVKWDMFALFVLISVRRMATLLALVIRGTILIKPLRLYRVTMIEKTQGRAGVTKPVRAMQQRISQKTNSRFCSGRPGWWPRFIAWNRILSR